MADTTPLSDDERAELERLRADKARREQAAAQARERAELESLRAEREHARADAAADRRDAERRERAREMMEPDEDLKMPLAQKLVLFLAAVIIAAIVLYISGNGVLLS